MLPTTLARAEHSVLTTLVALKELPGTMLLRPTLAKRWCGSSTGRQQADLDRAVKSLIAKEMLRENVTRTSIGLTMAGHNEATT